MYLVPMVLSSSASVSDPGVAPEVRRATAAWRESGEKTTFEEVAEEGSEERSWGGNRNGSFKNKLYLAGSIG